MEREQIITGESGDESVLEIATEWSAHTGQSGHLRRLWAEEEIPKVPEGSPITGQQGSGKGLAGSGLR